MIKKYKCYWCGWGFEKSVTYNANTDMKTGKSKKKGIVSSQVKCPNCCNLIPTWRKEFTRNIIGKKHIHVGR